MAASPVTLKPKIGMIVLYVMPDGQTVRPAIIVQVWTDTTVNLQVFTDPMNDKQISWNTGRGPYDAPLNVEYQSSVSFVPVANKIARSWHWVS